MPTTLVKVAATPELYTFNVRTLGECRIKSPVHHHEFIREGERILVTENASILEHLRERLGEMPSFERAGPLENIFHDPSWTRVGIVSA